jgi:hypothetical protein
VRHAKSCPVVSAKDSDELLIVDELAGRCER